VRGYSEDYLPLCQRRLRDARRHPFSISVFGDMRRRGYISAQLRGIISYIKPTKHMISGPSVSEALDP
jgi:hypothetical protein